MNCRHESQTYRKHRELTRLYRVETANGTQEHTSSYTVTFKSINQQTFMHTHGTEPYQDVPSGHVQTAKALM